MSPGSPQLIAGGGVPSLVQGQTSGFNPAKSLLRHPLLAALLLLLFLSLGGAYYVKSQQASYRSEALIYVSPDSAGSFLNSGEQRAYEPFMQQQIRSITRHEVLLASVVELNKRNIVWQREGESDAAAADRLGHLISAERVPDSYQLAISASGPAVDGYREVVNAVADTFIAKARQESFFGLPERAAVLAAERDELERSIAVSTGLQEKLREETGTGATGTQSNPQNDLLVRTMTEVFAVRQKRLEAETQIRTLESAPGGQRSQLLESVAENAVAADPAMTGLRTSLSQRRAALVAQLSGLSSSHPLRQRAEEELNDIDQDLRRTRETLVGGAATRLLNTLKADIARWKLMESELQQQVQEQTGLATVSAGKLGQIVSLAAQTDRMRARLAETQDQLRQMQLEHSLPGRMRIYSPARAPSEPEKQDRKKLLIAIFAVCASLAAGITVLVDVSDTTIRSAEDVERILGFGLRAVIPVRAAATEQFTDDQMLRLSLAVERSARVDNLKVVVFCSVRPGGGTTTIADRVRSDLRRLGLRTLSVQMRGPIPVTDVDHSHAPGSGTAVISLASIRDRSLAPSAGTLGDALRDMGRKYDLVLVDAAPALLSAETEYLVGIADAVLLIVEAGKVRKQDLDVSVKLLARLGVPAFGAILNRVSFKNAGHPVQVAWEAFVAARPPQKAAEDAAIFKSVRSDV